MQKYPDTLSVIENKNITDPQFIFRPHVIDAAASYFLNNFNGQIAYAVKANPEKYILKRLYAAGIKAFDVASLEEVKLLKSSLPKAYLYFMNTVKSRQAISAAYNEYNVVDFSLDSSYELSKILQETNKSSNLNLFVRLEVPNLHSKVSLANKFGIGAKEAISLLKETRKHALKLGVSFHVGSQCINPVAYKLALSTVENIIKESSIQIDVLNIGGGFPSTYPGMSFPSLDAYFKVIQNSINKIRKYNPAIEIMCEPGRALVAESGSEIVRVELIKNSHLYINDGTYGGLFDAGAFNLVYPVKIIRAKEEQKTKLAPYSLFGPTCDSIDFMPGPFLLPANIKEGEYFEIGQLGAYSRSLNTSFNGFRQEKEVIIVEDQPLMSLYTNSRLHNLQVINQSLYTKETLNEAKTINS